MEDGWKPMYLGVHQIIIRDKYTPLINNVYCDCDVQSVGERY